MARSLPLIQSWNSAASEGMSEPGGNSEELAREKVLVRGGASFPRERVADHSLAQKLPGWEPQVAFMDGLHRTIDWSFSTKNREQVLKEFETLLTERQAPALTITSKGVLHGRS